MVRSSFSRLCSLIVATSFLVMLSIFASESVAQNRSFNNRQLAKILDLTPAQEKMRQEIRAEYIDQSGSVLSQKGRQAYQDWLANLNGRYVESLNNRQRVVYQHYENWRKVGGRKSVDVLISKEANLLLDLTKDQKDRLKKLQQTIEADASDSKKKLEREVAENRTWLSQQLEDVLSRKQLLFYEEHIGKSFDFEKAGLGKVFGTASTMTPKGKSSSSRVDVSVQEFDPLLLVVPATKVDVPIRYPALVRLASNKTVASKLKLSARQSESIQSKYRAIQEMYSSIRHLQSGDGENERIQVVDDSGKNLHVHRDEESQIEELNELLTRKQQVQLVQIYNRFAIEVGAKDGIALLHEDWNRFLDLSDSQEKQFDSLKEEYVKRSMTAAKKFQDSISNNRANGYRKGMDVLSEKQTRIWLNAMGWFGKVEDETDRPSGK